MPEVQPTTTTPAAAPPPPAPAAPAAAKPDGRAEALKLLQAEDAPTAAPAAEPAKPAEAPQPTTRQDHAQLAREHQKLIADRDRLKVEQKQLEQQRTEAAEAIEAVKALREGKFEVLKKLRGEKWYDEATQHTVATLNPGTPEAKIVEIERKLSDVDKKLEQAKELTPEQKQQIEQAREAQLSGFRAAVVNEAKTDERFAEFNKNAEANALEVQKYLEAQHQSTGKQPTREDAVNAMLLAEAHLRVMKDLQNVTGTVTNESTTGKPANQVTGTPPTNDAKPGSTNLTDGLHASVSVKPAISRDDRRAAALALLRAPGAE